MAASQLVAPMPFVTLDAGCTVTLEAIDPLTGDAVSGVELSAVTIYATNDAGDAAPAPDALADFTYQADA